MTTIFVCTSQKELLSIKKPGPGQVVKLAALWRAAGHWGLCVLGVILSWLGHSREKSVELFNSK